MIPYQVTKATNQIPILISVPHCGVSFPHELRDQYDPALITNPEDTDWFVDRLYDFAPAMGISMITAVYSRWVIDLNRDPESKPLYNDGRIITGLCPTTTFLGEPLYRDKRQLLKENDIEYRLQHYYWPYHAQIELLLNELKFKFGNVLLWDCHSIKQIVPTIQKGKFPDLILGSADEKSASADLIDVALTSLRKSNYEVSYNRPFKGGFITRNFGKPQQHDHALQLEMCKVHYMDDAEEKYDQTRSRKMQDTLKATLAALGDKLIS